MVSCHLGKRKAVGTPIHAGGHRKISSPALKSRSAERRSTGASWPLTLTTVSTKAGACDRDVRRLLSKQIGL